MLADWQRLLKLEKAIKKGDFMAREIEIKLPLTEEEYKKLYSAIFGKSSYEGIQFLQADQPEHLFKQDNVLTLRLYYLLRMRWIGRSLLRIDRLLC